MSLTDRIFSINSFQTFERVALEVYEYQVQHCDVYREYVELLNWKKPESIHEIPFLPISFFKSHTVVDSTKTAQIVFKSSGTGGERSSHFVAKPEIYERSFNAIYDLQVGNPADQVILALLPNYLEQGESSLVYMVDRLIQRTNSELSGFFLDDLQGLIDRYTAATLQGKKVILFGVSYALLDLCELAPELSKATIIETGGMKGRRKELTKDELHAELKSGLNCKNIASEYGMTELLSQAYSTSEGLFNTCPWMHILLRDTNDPFHYIQEGTGGINVIDLANLHSCSFIATQDLGRHKDNGFNIVGRFDNSDIRGCNLLVQ